MKKGFISLGTEGNSINKDYIVRCKISDDKKLAYLVDVYGGKWTVDSKLVKGLLINE